MKASYARCDECPLRERPFVPGGFRGTPEVILVGEAPGGQEVKAGRPFVGPAGQLLDALLAAAGVDPKRTFLTNAVLCRPKRNELPESALDYCRPRLLHELKQVRKRYPVPVVAFGRAPTMALLNEVHRGCWQLGPNDTPVLPLFHPAHTLRSPNTATETLLGLRKLHRPIPKLPVEPDTQHVVLEDATAVKKWVTAMIKRGGTLAWDLETDQLNWRHDRILCFAASWAPGRAIIIPGKFMYYTIAPRLYLADLFTAPNITFVAHGGTFDVKFMRHQLDVLPARDDFDTLLAHYTLDERTSGAGGAGIHSLKTLITAEFDLPDYEQDLVQRYLKSRHDHYSKVPASQLYKYGAIDADYTLRLAGVLEERLREEGLYERPFLEPLMAAVEPIIAMEMHGVPIDARELARLEQTLTAKRDLFHKEMEEHVGHEFNPRSWQQKGAILYDQYGCQIVAGINIKPRSTAAGARDKLKKLYGPETEPGAFLRMLDKYSKVEKLRSSYASNILKLVDNDRVYPTFKLHGAETGRLSATKPAIQTIPRSGEKYGKMIKQTYRASAGFAIVEVDYSQAEMRVAAAMSGDEFLLQIYRDDRDLHDEVAIAMFGDNFTSVQRILSKMFNFSYLYGGTERSFAVDAGLPMDVATDFVRRYNATMPRLAAWKDDQARVMRKQGYVDTPFGRRRRFPLILAVNANEARKAAVSQPVSGSASDLTLTSSRRIWEWLEANPKLKPYVRPIITVHDSLVFEIAKRLAYDVGMKVKQTMEEVAREYFPQVVWRADVKIGPSWGELEPT